MTDNTIDHAIASTRSLQWVALEHLHFNPWQMWPIDPQHVAELSADIARNGVLQPPLARPHPTKPGEYQLAFGHHRRAAVAARGGGRRCVHRFRARLSDRCGGGALMNDKIDLAEIIQAALIAVLSIAAAAAIMWLMWDALRYWG